MTVRRRSVRAVGDSRLPWEPPSLSSPYLAVITSDPASRDIQLTSGQDCLITSAGPVSFIPSATGQHEAIVQVFSGRNIVWIGGEIIGEGGPVTTVTSAIATDDTTITVASTAGFPSGGGWIRIDGEGMLYDSITATTFNVTERRYGFYNSGTGSSDTTHAIDATVYLGEYSRSAISLSHNHGEVHIEGLNIDGFINDGVRVLGGTSTSVTVQNCRIGPVTNHDHTGQSDGHPDAIQLALSGTQHLRVARSTILAGQSGRGILNAASGVGETAVPEITVLDTEIIQVGENIQQINNADLTTAWTVGNAWLRTNLQKSATVTTAAVAEKFGKAPVTDRGPDFCPESVPGVGYTTPGYI